MHLESLHSASLFPHSVLLQPYSKMDYSHCYVKILHIMPHNDVEDICLKYLQSFWKYKWKKSHLFTAFDITLKIELRCILLPLIILAMFLQLDWSPLVVNSVNWTWFGKAHACLYKVPQLTVHNSQDCIKARIWGRVQKNVCSIKCLNEHSGLYHP